MARNLVAVLLVVLLAACSGGGAEPEGPGVAASGPASEAPASDSPASEAPASEAAAAWQEAAGALRPLTEVAAAAHDGQVWVAGGYAQDGSWVTDVQVYDPEAGTWEAGPPLPVEVNHAALVSTGDRLHLLGGYAGPAHAPTDAVRVLDPATGVWEDGPALPEPRAAGAAAFDGDRIVYGGGVGPDGVAQDIWALEDGDWREVGSLGVAREHLAAASDGEGVVWFLAGRRGGLDQNVPDVDVVTGERTRRLGSLPTARGGIAGFHVPGAGGCAAGGEGPEGTFTEVECMNDAGAVTTLPELSAPRHGIGATTLDDTAYVLLGGPQPGLTVSDTVQTLPLPAPGS